jgi:hypothetical protein
MTITTQPINEGIGWYICHEILYFELADPSEQQEFLVWENLILIRAQNPEEAYQKAMQHGSYSEEEVTINGKKGYCKFKGLRTLMPIYEEIEDGAEVEWMEYNVSKEKLETLVEPKGKLQAFLPLPFEEELEEKAGDEGI